MNIRLARAEDLIGMQASNLQNLPENYTMRFWIYHLMSWPQLSYVAEDHKGRIVGYVLSKIDEPDEDNPEGETHGHVNSISVLREYRRLGIARKMMLLSQDAMEKIHGAAYCSLHVRKSNKAAIALYKETLGFEVARIEKKYYGDGEDALYMRLYFDPEENQTS